MTWDETIKFIRTKPEFKKLVEKAYFEEDLSLNVERFKSDEEFVETLALLNQYAPSAKRILDVGSGNGISAIAFALHGFDVTALEPDPSSTVGAGAIRILKNHYQLDNIDVLEGFAENLQIEDASFDIVYVRQAMHHAHDLNQFIKNLSSLITPGGFLFTVRDHVIYNEEDKKWFLESHPLQKYYGGENAYTSQQYQSAMSDAGLEIKKTWRHYDSVLNYFPMTRNDFQTLPRLREKEINERLVKKIGFLGYIPLLQKLYLKRVGFNRDNLFDEKEVAGRMYSYLAQKK